MKLAEVVQHLDAIAPPHTAEAWDNVGLLVGDTAAIVTRAILCIDYTAGVAAEAKAAGCDFVLAYHPPIFKPLKKLTASGASSLVFEAARRGVAIYSPHTALDVAAGGTNDVLADLLGLVDRRPLKPSELKATECKLVTFVPTEHVDAVAEALFAAGAGRIGDYSRCSFRSSGVGTFFGEAGTNPAVGQAGQSESVPEVRVETVVPLSKIGDVISALKRSHPYETPAFDLVTLAAPPASAGIGRVGKLPSPAMREELFNTLKQGLGIGHLLIAGPQSGEVKTVAVCAGACGEFLDQAIAAKVDVYVTGEMRHHDALRAAAAGLTVVCTLHSNSERITLGKLAERLTKELPAITWQVSAVDADPFSIR
ncbi:MAG: Nif3-like dinuclear metal center hexameric protein [Tepidisphaeraceae bacterium]